VARKRRGRSEGSIFQREEDGLWVGTISLGYDGAGRRVRRTVYGANKGEVQEKLRKLQADHDAGRLVETERLTVGEYLTRWLQHTAKPKVHDGTWERYREVTELYVVPILGGVRLEGLV
jgi:integrase